MSDTSAESRPCCTGQTSRRSAIGTLVGLGAAVLAYLTPVVSAAVSFFYPVRKKSALGDFRFLGTVDMLPDDGSPVQVTVRADLSDAWNRFSNEPVGGVFLRKLPDGSVLALHTTCPHAGCTVMFQKAANKLFCPCHAASFSLDGKRLDERSPSPRDLDTLDVEIRNGNEIWVRFVNFRTGIPDKVEEV